MSDLVKSGKYLGQLTGIVNSMIEQKKNNGEKLSLENIESIENDIFEAYQKILSALRDPNDISNAVSKLEKVVSSSGTVEVSKIANTVIKQTLNEKEYNNDEKINTDETTAHMVKSLLEEHVKLSISDEAIKDINDNIIKAKNGDIFAAASVVASENALEFVAKGDLEPRKAMDKIMFILVQDPKSQVAIELAKKANLDVFDSENGKEIFNKEKFDILYKQESEKKPTLASKLTPEQMQEINRRRAKRQINRGDFSKKTAESIIGEAEKKAEVKRVRKAIKKAYEFDSPELIQQIVKDNFEISKQILKEDLCMCEKVQKRDQNAPDVKKLQNSNMILGEAITQVSREKVQVESSKTNIQNETINKSLPNRDDER